MRVLFATAELSPIATVGGLAAAAAGLSLELRRQGVDVELTVPDYGEVKLSNESVIELDVPAWARPARIRVGDHPIAGRLHLVDVPGMARSHPYLKPDGDGWPDNAERFFRFARAIAARVEHAPPDVLHLNDWHTGAALAALTQQPPTVLSIHNLAYQGVAPGTWLRRIGPRAAHYEWWGGTNPLTGAIALSDAIVAVSPTYAKEILTPELGRGIDGPLAYRGDALSGILNGIDTTVWDPSTDRHIVSTYDVDHIEAKAPNRAALIERLGFTGPDVPLAVAVTRLTDQKGIDLLVPLVPLLEQIPMRLAVLGSGDAHLAATLHGAAGAHPDWFAFIEGYDESLSHLMFAGADLFVMPSRFEPCGLTQMQAMRYGTVPIVTGVGGLVDTVPDADADRRNGRGFVAARPASTDLLAAMFRAGRRVTDRRRHATLQRRGMAVDWSWRRPATDYVELYERLLARR
ncbi:MAG TPA: glycogen/starch synthase [Ilumatobacteraceae bacterium]|nr:glycogen/starch synthase [Ilumatobacteraceae bacterium]